MLNRKNGLTIIRTYDTLRIHKGDAPGRTEKPPRPFLMASKIEPAVLTA
jgi:hypothetical protein